MFPEGLIPHLVTEGARRPNTDPAGRKAEEATRFLEVRPMGRTLELKSTTVYSFKESQTEAQRSGDLPEAMLRGGKKARSKSHSTETPNPMLPFSVGLLVVGPEQQ